MKLLYRMVLELTANRIPVTFFHDDHTGTINGFWDEAPATIFVGDFIHMTISAEKYISIVCECENEHFQFSEFDNVSDAITWIKEILDTYDFEFKFRGYYKPAPDDDYVIDIK
jgi:hypothetical protein